MARRFSPRRSATGGGGSVLFGGQVRTTNSPLAFLIRAAYGLRMTDELLGGPDWIETYGFDVDAKPAGRVTVAQARLMLRTLLADRFKLVVRRESRDRPIYALVRARRDGELGPQIKRPKGDCVMVMPGFVRAATLSFGRGRAAAVSPDSAPEPGSLPSLFTAPQQQLGLRLDAQRGPVDALVVHEADLPAEH